MEGALMKKGNKKGFTLVEALIAGTLMLLLVLMVTSSMLESLKSTKAGTSQVQYLSNARFAQEKIMKIVNDGWILSTINSGAQLLIQTDPVGDNSIVQSLIWYQDQDNNSNTTANNFLWYDPNRVVAGDERILLRNVRPLGTNAIFTVVNGGRGAGTARFRFHVGDSSTELGKFSTSGMGYQGVDVKFSATPRDLKLNERYKGSGYSP